MPSITACTAPAGAAVPAGIDGQSRNSLERQLFEAIRATPATDPRSRSHARRLALALIHLRRTHAAVYDPGDHARFRRRESRCFVAELAEQSLQNGYPPGSAVHVIGEPYDGTVIHVAPGWDAGDPYPAMWYVVAVASLKLCRGHGADEIEPVVPHR
ncbi:hypothetical protein OHA98_22580 [Streptomyces sp. NBC_00654]|uniref:hypothetical protein n=1 Tax=Streptomyces sp. NBC_00654 TaxID=2975799 RepID=UPI0022531961|nr:hypothetical protein [Streptomyces sp. NBC_00654]MCX4967494.1 hypothetical protein [Streptomyces sp. NBC_00654]